MELGVFVEKRFGSGLLLFVYTVFYHKTIIKIPFSSTVCIVVEVGDISIFNNYVILFGQILLGFVALVYCVGPRILGLSYSVYLIFKMRFSNCNSGLIAL